MTTRGSFRQLIVPAPSLIGLPEDGLQTQYFDEFYRRPILMGIIAEQTGYSCCEHALYFAALAEQLLVDLEIVPPSLTAADYANLLLHEEIAFDLRIDVGWRDGWLEANHQQAWMKAVAIAAFLREADPNLSLTEAIGLISFRGQRLTVWLELLLALNEPAGGLGSVWEPDFRSIPGSAVDHGNALLYRFLYERSRLVGEPWPSNPPGDDLLFVCRDRSDTRLLSFDPVSESWQNLARFQETLDVLVRPLPAKNQFGLFRYTNNDVPNTTFFWNGQEMVALERWLTPSNITTWPNGTLFITRYYSSGVASYFWLDPDTCFDQGCRIEEVEFALISLSPGGQNMLTAVQNEDGARRYQLQNSSGTVFQSDLPQPLYNDATWLDDQTIAFVPVENQQQVAAYSLSDPSPVYIIEMAGLIPLLPAHVAREYSFDGLTVDPQNSGRLYLNIVVDAVVDLRYVVAFDLATGRGRWVSNIGQAGFYTRQPHPAYLTGHHYSAEGQRYMFLLYHSQTDTAQLYPTRSSVNSYPAHDWDSAGEWLLLFGGGHARLIRPGLPEIWPVFPPYERCSSASWLAKK